MPQLRRVREPLRTAKVDALFLQFRVKRKLILLVGIWAFETVLLGLGGGHGDGATRTDLVHEGAGAGGEDEGGDTTGDGDGELLGNTAGDILREVGRGGVRVFGHDDLLE